MDFALSQRLDKRVLLWNSSSVSTARKNMQQGKQWAEQHCYFTDIVNVVVSLSIVEIIDEEIYHQTNVWLHPLTRSHLLLLWSKWTPCYSIRMAFGARIKRGEEVASLQTGRACMDCLNMSMIKWPNLSWQSWLVYGESCVKAEYSLSCFCSWHYLFL